MPLGYKPVGAFDVLTRISDKRSSQGPSREIKPLTLRGSPTHDFRHICNCGVRQNTRALTYPLNRLKKWRTQREPNSLHFGLVASRAGGFQNGVIRRVPDVGNLEDRTAYNFAYSVVDENPELQRNSMKRMVGASGFEPPTSWSRTRRSSQAEPRPEGYNGCRRKSCRNFRITQFSPLRIVLQVTRPGPIASAPVGPQVLG
jgi:hypothetical protein